ncbi:MAG TPA: riboflavin biosynthesis protein RibF [Myxococcota bacterium]|nr:riboflavin biosynthesis protein RibF [Myxococcota bacterium]
MRRYDDFSELQADKNPCVVAVGSFDGLHRGHQLLFRQVREDAARMHIEAGVLTFKPHPARVLAPGYAPPLIMSPERKLRALARLGLDFTLQQRFDSDFAALTAEDFSSRVLAGAMDARLVVVGDDFTFGRDRAGHAEDLARQGKRLGFEVQVTRRLAVEGMIVSSTRIRSFLLQGKVKGAGLLLGRPYTVDGEVVGGAGRGRQLGFPTVNIKADCDILPPRGVYACHFWPPDSAPARPAATNIGVCPTFGPGQLSVEAHILDGGVGDLTGRRVALGFLERLRPEQRFESPADLQRQIGRDVIQAREVVMAHQATAAIDPLDGI